VTPSRRPDLLVTGTDTGVGKTVIAAALILARRDAGLRTIGFKPVETGVGTEEPADSAILAAAAAAEDAEALAEPIAQLREPLAPAIAAERAHVQLESAEIERRVRSLREAGWGVIVEGAGGLLVPLTWGYTALDLAARVGLAAVVVGRAGLGTLNHMQLTVEALRRRGVPVRALILNACGDPPDLAESTNPAALMRLLPGIPVVVVPRSDAHDPLEVARRSAVRLGGL
jgi:dethiobiotin synthetase